MSYAKDESRSSPDLKSMDWITGNSLLPGLPFKFRVNEYGLIEVAEGGPPEGNEPSPSPELPEKSEDDQDEDIISCKSCKGYGFAKDFIQASYCSIKCRFKPSMYSKETSSDAAEDETNRNLKRKYLTEISVPAPIKKERVSTSSEPEKSENIKKVAFSWAKYLEKRKAQAAPEKLFSDPFPFTKHGFRVGMKLEGIDPEHQYLFCVLTVAEVHGYRMRLHFDGYSDSYDFWVNADSNNIFPAGWCEKNGQKLQPPKGYDNQKPFSWTQYLRNTGGHAAPRHLFTTQSISPVPSAFRIGMKLEAVDRRHSTRAVCVASVANVLGPRFLVHFDGWDSIYDYWADPTCPHVHPVGWCEQNKQTLLPPCNYEQTLLAPRNYEGKFSWEKYLAETRTTAVPPRAFKPRSPAGFKAGLMLESVDPRNPQFIRVATVIAVKGYRLKIHFDGWSSELDFWTDDDWTDIHPPGWCQKTGHALQSPLITADCADTKRPCPTHGCSGLGHVEGPKYSSHSILEHCPYASVNIFRENNPLKDRLAEDSTPEERDVDLEKKKIGKKSLETPQQQQQLSSPKKKSFWKKKRPVSPVAVNVATVAPNRNLNKITGEEISQSVLSLDPSQFNSNLITPFCWSKHVNVLGETASSLVGKDVASWTVDQVVELVGKFGLGPEELELFRQQEIDGPSFLMLAQSDLTEMLKLKLGPAVKIYNTILCLQRR